MSDSKTLLKSTSVGWWGVDPDEMDLSNPLPFTVEEYKNLEDTRFDNKYIPILFTINDPTLFGLPPKLPQSNDVGIPPYLKFKLTVFTYLYQNRFWRPAQDLSYGDNWNYMSINFQAVEHNDLPKMNMSILENLMFEMAMFHFGYDFTEYPHKQYSDELYEKYTEFCIEKQQAMEEIGVTDIKFDPASKKTVKQVLLAIEYLHFIDRFRYSQATTLMATPQLVGDYNYWWKWFYTNSLDEIKEERKKKLKVLQTTLSRIEPDVLTRLGIKGTVGGQLTDRAIRVYQNWIQSQGKLGMEYNWGVVGAFGPKSEEKE